MKELGVHMIPAYSPQARGRSQRNFSTWQGRLPQELRLRGIRTLEGANDFLNEHYIAEFNRRFTVPAESAERRLYPAGTGIWKWSLRSDSSAQLTRTTPYAFTTWLCSSSAPTGAIPSPDARQSSISTWTLP